MVYIGPITRIERGGDITKTPAPGASPTAMQTGIQRGQVHGPGDGGGGGGGGGVRPPHIHHSRSIPSDLSGVKLA